MKKVFLIIGILTVSFALIFIGMEKSKADFFAPERTFLVHEKIQLTDLPKDATNLRLWIPYPVSDNSQIITDFKLKSSFKDSIVVDPKYGNKIVYLEMELERSREDIPEVTISYKVIRKAFSGSSDTAEPEEVLSSFLAPNKTVPVNEEMKRLAEEITSGKQTDIAKARAIYDYILDELHYAKDDPSVCGVGDTLITLEAKKGICTDYHSLFMSLTRSMGIPAKFEIGYRVPADKSEGRLPGYHCWAKFHLKDKGWIPVDISEADKHPEKRDYYFGNIDANRFHLTTGRDINLENARDSQPLNFFVYPYGELDNKMLTSLILDIEYKDLKKNK